MRTVDVPGNERNRRRGWPPPPRFRNSGPDRGSGKVRHVWTGKDGKAVNEDEGKNFLFGKFKQARRKGLLSHRAVIFPGEFVIVGESFFLGAFHSASRSEALLGPRGGGCTLPTLRVPGEGGSAGLSIPRGRRYRARPGSSSEYYPRKS